MQVLEKILQEIEEIQDKDNEDYMLVQECEAEKSNTSRKIDCAANNGFQRCAEKIKEIIRSHMEDESHAQDSECVWLEDAAGGRILRLPKEEKNNEV